jgi:hypothetical protein
LFDLFNFERGGEESGSKNEKWNQNRRWPRGYDLGGADFFA